MEQQAKEKRENIAAGVAGALLGSLLGVLCTVVIGQLGYVASISGLVMAVGALKGYELLGGTLSKKGAVISSVLVLVMTWLAHRLTWAIAVSSATGFGVFQAFRAMPILLETGSVEGASYWGDLVMLYLFTLLGAVPTIIGGLRSTSMPDLPQGAAAAAQGEEAARADFYPGKLAWMRPLRVSAALSMLVGLVPCVVLLFVAFSQDYAFTPILAAMGCLAGCLVMMIPALICVRQCYGAAHLMVRVRGTLWRVNLPMLNAADTYRFTKKLAPMRGLRWEILEEEERERLKASVLRAVDLLSSGQVMPGSALSVAVMPLTELRIDGETKWAWKGVYSAGGGKEKKVTIPKAYPDFAPAPGLEPAQEPAPARWGLLGLGVALAALLGLAGAGLGARLDGGVPGGTPGLNTPAPASPPPVQSASQPVESDNVITDELARSRFHVGEELGYSYTAVGYIKAPAGMFGYEGAFVDAHVPYSEDPQYLDGGYTIRSAAHGMEVTVTIAQTDGGNAASLVDQAYELLKERGTDIYEDSTTETHYFEEYDIAVKQVAYFEEDRTKVRVVVLYADCKQDGYYLSAAILYQPELLDEEYPALLAELSDAYALNLPEIPAMDQA